MTGETSYDVQVESVTQTDRIFLDSSGNPQERVVHKVVAAKEDGVKVTLQSPDPFPWSLGDPLTVTVAATQSHLDDYEEEKGEEGKEGGK